VIKRSVNCYAMAVHTGDSSLGPRKYDQNSSTFMRVRVRVESKGKEWVSVAVCTGITACKDIARPDGSLLSALRTTEEPHRACPRYSKSNSNPD
jgi:hypothetical protein